MGEQVTKIELSDWDKNSPPVGATSNFEFFDPQRPDNVYCLGFRFMGGDPHNPKNYTYDHTNLWDARLGVTEQEPIHITPDQIRDLLSRYGSLPENLLEDYCKRLGHQ